MFLRTYFDAASNAAPAAEMVPYSVAFASSNDFTELALPSSRARIGCKTDWGYEYKK